MRVLVFFFECSATPRVLHFLAPSFPPRLSSDLCRCGRYAERHLAGRRARPSAMTLAERRPPQQDRARQTRKRLLDVAGELLAEVGVERISTNMIAARAGLTPPALYRYFNDKYAVLEALGRRSEEHTSELQSLMRISYAVFCLKKKKNTNNT